MADKLESAIPVGLIATVLSSRNALSLTTGSNTHDPALGYARELADHTRDVKRVVAIAKALLPEDYSGNTLRELPRMFEDWVKSGRADEPPASKATTIAMVLLAQARAAGIELFHNRQGKAFASVSTDQGGRVCYEISSRAISRWLRLLYFRAARRPPSKEALSDVVLQLDAEASISPPEEVHVRVAKGPGGEAYYDLGRDDGVVVEITSEGWKLTSNCPVRFYRPSGFGSQVDPQPGGDWEALRICLQLDFPDWILVVAFLIASLNPLGPYMILLVGGEQGSGKSFLCSLIKRLLDPNAIEKLRLPKDEHTLAIQASENHVLVYDNASSLRWDMSDAICVLATGGGFSTRKFYTDNESQTFKHSRPVVINGIGEFADRPDLVERAIRPVLPAIDARRRKTEADILAEFESILPKFLGCLFDAASAALRWQSRVEVPTTIRMTDAARWLVAAESAVGLPAQERAEFAQTGKKPKGARFLNMLGAFKLDQLTTAQIRTWHRTVAEACGAYTARRALSHLRSILALAEEDFRVRAPSIPTGLTRARQKVKKAILTPSDIAAIIAAAKSDPERGLYYAFPFLAGTRPSEQLGLLWEDVDFDKGIIGIRRIQERDGSTTDMTKTEAGTRDIPMGPTLREMLLAWRLRCPRLVGDLYRVFPGPGRLQPWPKPRVGGGTALLYQNFRKRYWAPIFMRLGLPYVTPHSARHSFISTLQAQGIEVGLVAKLAGHASPAVTLGHYTQAVRGGEAAVAALERAYASS